MKKVKCNHCEYEWETKSENYLVVCPRCMNKVRIKDFKKLPRNQTMKNIKEHIEHGKNN